MNGAHVGAICSILWLNGDDNTYGCNWDAEEALLKRIIKLRDDTMGGCNSDAEKALLKYIIEFFDTCSKIALKLFIHDKQIFLFM